VGRINYSQIKKQKEATRKLRQQSKLDQRARKDPESERGDVERMSGDGSPTDAVAASGPDSSGSS